MGVKVLDNGDVEFRGTSNDVLLNCNKSQKALIENVISAFYDYEKRRDAKDSIHSYNTLRMKEVIFHGSATIIYWADGDKTVVKCMDGDIFNPEMGIAMATLKKMLGDSYKEFKKHSAEIIADNKEKDRKKKLKKYVKELKGLVEEVRALEANNEPET